MDSPPRVFNLLTTHGQSFRSTDYTEKRDKSRHVLNSTPSDLPGQPTENSLNTHTHTPLIYFYTHRQI